MGVTEPAKIPTTAEAGAKGLRGGARRQKEEVLAKRGGSEIWSLEVVLHTGESMSLSVQGYQCEVQCRATTLRSKKRVTVRLVRVVRVMHKRVRLMYNRLAQTCTTADTHTPKKCALLKES